MATKTDYPNYLPVDFRGLPSVPDGNRRLYFSPQKDGTNILYGEVITKSRIVIRYPAGSSISFLPPSSVGSKEIKDGSVQAEDLDPRMVATIRETRDIVARAIAGEN